MNFNEHLTLWCLESPGSRTFRARVQHMGRGATSFQRSLSLADGKTWAQEIVLGHVNNASHIPMFPSISIYFNPYGINLFPSVSIYVHYLHYSLYSFGFMCTKGVFLGSP